jgi:structural maintenance of chromosome 4
VAKAKADLEITNQDREATKSKRVALEDEATAIQDSFKELEELHDAAAQKVQALVLEHSDVKKKLKVARQAELPLVEQVNETNRIVVVAKGDIRELEKTLRKVRRKLRQLEQAVSDAALAVAATDDDAINDDAVNDDDAGAEDRDDKSRLNDTNTESNTSGVDMSKGDDAMDLDAAVGAEAAEDIVTLNSAEMSDLEKAIALLEADLANIKPNLSAIVEYRQKDVEYKAQVGELDSLTGRRDAARKDNDTLRKARLDEFMQGFGVITVKLKELYQMITLGGDAELELVDSLDPFSEGIVFSVRPPKKSWKNISNLSGGEKTLSSLALVFALHHFKPTPLYFLDEIDAALDFKNVSIVANYIKERTKDAQFIIISLRNNMFELADRLVGIYKTYNTTKSVSINPKAFVMPSGSSAPPLSQSQPGTQVTQAATAIL